jgi:hypothetical protein
MQLLCMYVVTFSFVQTFALVGEKKHIKVDVVTCASMCIVLFHSHSFFVVLLSLDQSVVTGVQSRS